MNVFLFKGSSILSQRQEQRGQFMREGEQKAKTKTPKKKLQD